MSRDSKSCWALVLLAGLMGCSGSEVTNQGASSEAPEAAQQQAADDESRDSPPGDLAEVPDSAGSPESPPDVNPQPVPVAAQADQSKATQSKAAYSNVAQPQQDPQKGKPMDVEVTPYGKTKSGEAVELVTLKNRQGMTAKIISYGATLVSLEMPDREGKLANVVLGYDTLADYEAGSSYFGATVGRYANRIAAGKFTLDGQEHTLATNNGPNHLHGGKAGFSHKVWRVETNNDLEPSATFTYTSPDGEEGYPGELNAAVTYTLTGDNRLRIDYGATSDKKTHCNLTHHSYFNLAGHDSGDVLGHHITIKADKYLPVDEGLIPAGELADVKETPFDLNRAKLIGDVITQQAGLYDHAFVLDKPSDPEALPEVVAKVTDPKSGRTLEIFTTEPAIQFYTANHLSGEKGAGGATYPKHAGLCLETQHYPDSPNKPDFPSTVLEPGKIYRSTTVHKFGVEKN